EKLISALERDEKVVKVPLALHADGAGPGRAPLQTGSFIAFSQPVDPGRFTLDQSGIVMEKNKPANVSYCVFSIETIAEAAPEFVISQKIATLLTQIDRGNANAAANTVTFLADTLAQYSNFNKLTRYQGLVKKANRTAEEDALLQEIGQID